MYRRSPTTRPLRRRRSVSRGPFYRKRPALTRNPADDTHPDDMCHLELTLHDFHDVFKDHPDLEQKYLNMMKMPITGKESIKLPFNFRSYRQHTCLDLSPYGNDQILKSACITCRDDRSHPTASDAMVAFINQTSSIMKNRRFYYGFKKDMDLINMSATQPQLFQVYHIVHSALPNTVPVMYAQNGLLHMHLVFEEHEIHIPCDCINQVIAVCKDNYSVVLDIIKGHIVLAITCLRPALTTVRIDVAVLQRKVDEMEIPNDVSEQFERYKTVLDDMHARRFISPHL